MLNSTRILNVKIQETSKGKVILIGWETKGENGWERQTIKSKDTPRPELYNVMRAMGLHALKMCELEHKQADLSTNWQADEVTIKYSDGVSSRRGVKIKVSIPVNGGYIFKFKTPTWLITNDDNKLQTDIDLLTDEAMRYINGDRAQSTLDLEVIGGTEA
jgi:hypothetical protein